ALARTLYAAVAFAATLHRALLQCLAQRLTQGRIQVFVDARAQCGENRVGFRGSVQGDDHRVAARPADGSYQAFQRLSPAADVHQYDVRPHPLQTIDKRSEVADILVLHDDAEWQISQAALRLLPKIPVLDRQPDCQRVHILSSFSNSPFGDQLP